jgi:hypothetical protein
MADLDEWVPVNSWIKYDSYAEADVEMEGWDVSTEQFVTLSQGDLRNKRYTFHNEDRALYGRGQAFPRFLFVRAKLSDIRRVTSIALPEPTGAPSSRIQTPIPPMWQSIRQAYKKLWPCGEPVGQRPIARNKKISELLKKEEREVPASKTIRRALKGWPSQDRGQTETSLDCP